MLRSSILNIYNHLSIEHEKRKPTKNNMQASYLKTRKKYFFHHSNKLRHHAATNDVTTGPADGLFTFPSLDRLPFDFEIFT